MLILPVVVKELVRVRVRVRVGVRVRTGIGVCDRRGRELVLESALGFAGQQHLVFVLGSGTSEQMLGASTWSAARGGAHVEGSYAPSASLVPSASAAAPDACFGA